MRKIIAPVFLTLALLAGCGSGGSSDAPAPSVEPTPCGKSCSDKEVDITGCSRGAVTVVNPRAVKAGRTRGHLELRKARPSVCTRMYWARFVPSTSNKAPFEIMISVDGRTFTPQVSEKDVPTMEAWTRGEYADVGGVIRICLKSGGTSTCLEDYVVTS